MHGGAAAGRAVRVPSDAGAVGHAGAECDCVTIQTEDRDCTTAGCKDEVDLRQRLAATGSDAGLVADPGLGCSTVILRLGMSKAVLLSDGIVSILCSEPLKRVLTLPGMP